MAHQIFISYAVEDKTIADAVCEAIEREGIKCWYAPRDVAYGRDFEESIVDAIGESRLLILVLTSHSNSSAHVKREIQNACLEEVGVPVLPFRVEDVPLNKALRYYIGSVHWLDAITTPLDPHLRLLVEHVKARLPKPPGPDPVGDEKPGSTTGSSDAPPTVPDHKPVWIPPQVVDVHSPPPTVPVPVQPPPGPPVNVLNLPPKVPNYLLPSIFATFLCCLPAGVTAIVMSVQASNKAAAGHIVEAMARARLAKIFLITAVISGFMIYLLYGVPTAIQILKQKPSVSPSPTPYARMPAPTPAVNAPPLPMLSGLSVRVFYKSPSKAVADKIADRLKSTGARVELSEEATAPNFKDISYLYFYGDRKVDARRISQTLTAIEYVNVADNNSGPTRTIDEFQFFLWVGLNSR